MMYNKELEEQVLAAMLFDADAVKTVARIVSSEDFFVAENRVVFDAMISLAQKDIPIDVCTLTAELTAMDKLDAIGGSKALTIIAVAYFTSTNAKHHAEEVRSLSEARKIQAGAAEIQKKGSRVTINDIKELLAKAESSQYVNNYTDKAAKSIEQFKAGLRTQQPRIETGFPSLDKVTGGLRLGTVCIVGAYPSVGKTMLALNIASKQKEPIVIFSLEMTGAMIIERMAAAELKLDYGIFNHGKFSNNQIEVLDQFADGLEAKQIHLFDDERYIERHAEITAKVKPGMIVVDFIQKVRTHKKTDSKRLEIEHISGMYKQIAAENNCLVLLLSQLARPDKTVRNPRPNMHSLKESGALEADGDVILMIHRPHVLDKNNPEISPEESDILVAKNKFGQTGKIDLHFDGKYQIFREVEKRPTWGNVITNKRGGSEYDDGNDEWDDLPI